MSHVRTKFQITPKLFLASVAAQSLEKAGNLFPNKPKNQTNVVFIPTAADPYEDKSFVETDRSKLEHMGFNVFDFDIKGKEKRELEEDLRQVDIIFVAGGNSFYLLDQIQKSGFDEILKKLVLGKGILYVGSSAGSVVVGPDIKPVELFDDPKEAPDIVSTKALEFVDFVVLPHYGKQKYEERYKKITKKYKNKFDLVKITDDQAIYVEGLKWIIV